MDLGAKTQERANAVNSTERGRKSIERTREIAGSVAVPAPQAVSLGG
jgi:hypothetical protein